MAHKTEVGDCPLHGEYYMDAGDSPCPSCEENEVDPNEDFETKIFRLIDAGHLNETIYFDFLDEDERIDLIAYIRIKREKEQEAEAEAYEYRRSNVEISIDGNDYVEFDTALKKEILRRKATKDEVDHFKITDGVE